VPGAGNAGALLQHCVHMQSDGMTAYREPLDSCSGESITCDRGDGPRHSPGVAAVMLVPPCTAQLSLPRLANTSVPQRWPRACLMMLAGLLGWLNAVSAQQPGTIYTYAGGGASTSDFVLATAANIGGPTGLALLGDGSLVIANNGNSLRRVWPNGTLSFLCAGCFVSATDAALAADGSLYVAEGVACKVRRLTPAGTVVDFLGTGVNASTGDGGPASAATVSVPFSVDVVPAGPWAGAVVVAEWADGGSGRARIVYANGTVGTLMQGTSFGVTVGPDNSVYLSDASTTRLVRISPLTGLTTLVAGGGSGGDGGLATAAAIGWPGAVAAAADGRIFIPDWTFTVVRLVLANGTITTIAGIPGNASLSGDGGPAYLATVNRPYAVQLGPDGTLYTADYFNNRVRAIAPGASPAPSSTATASATATATLSVTSAISSTATGTATVSASGSASASPTGSSSAAPTAAVMQPGTIYTVASITSPYGLAYMADGSLLVANVGNGLVRVWPNGTLTTMCAGCFTSAMDAAVGADGSVYVADWIANKVRRITPGCALVDFLGNGTAASTGDGGPAATATVNQPYSVDVITTGLWAGAVVVAEFGGPGRARIVYANGTVGTLMQTQTVGIAAGPDGAVYVSGWATMLVYRIVPTTGSATVVAGGGLGPDGSLATAALLGQPGAVAIAADGRIFIPEQDYSRLRLVLPNGTITTVTGRYNSGSFSGDGGPAYKATLNGPWAVVLGADGTPSRLAQARRRLPRPRLAPPPPPRYRSPARSAVAVAARPRAQPPPPPP
jgi:hypothetical protein